MVTEISAILFEHVNHCKIYSVYTYNGYCLILEGGLHWTIHRSGAGLHCDWGIYYLSETRYLKVVYIYICKPNVKNDLLKLSWNTQQMQAGNTHIM